jgi:uncharacterized protein
MGSEEYRRGRVIVARLPHGADLLDEIVGLALRHGIEAGALEGVGALQRARLAFYDQEAWSYREFGVARPMEIVSLLGTVSRHDGRPAAHVHLSLADHDGGTLGGHAAGGCIVFACELTLSELLGAPLERGHDEVTGLALWRGL